MVYTTDDPIVARELEAIGCVAIMPLASLIGSGMGILNPWNLKLIIDAAKVPVLVDAGVGTASDATIAMELGCAGVLMNTAIAGARDPVRMAGAMKLAVEAGREAFLAGRMPRKHLRGEPELSDHRPHRLTLPGGRADGGQERFRWRSRDMPDSRRAARSSSPRLQRSPRQPRTPCR